MHTDPRTVARQIPGLLDDVLPQLTAGLVAHFNNGAVKIDVQTLNATLLLQSKLQRAMLFELGYAAAEQLLITPSIDWNHTTATAFARQRKFYDAVLPLQLEAGDKILAEVVARNLRKMLFDLSVDSGNGVCVSPNIPGYEWIANGTGDFSLGDSIIEVKCSSRKFTTADYRQVIVYWLLSYAASVEGRGREWREIVLINPRLGIRVQFKIDLFISYAGNGMTKIEILQAFQAAIGTRLNR